MTFSAIALAVVVFASTNIDDILLLSAFFADHRIKTQSVVIGQFAGIAALTAASAAAALLNWIVPEAWIAMLGLAPLALGVRGLYRLWVTRPPREAVENLGPKGPGPSPRSQWVAVALVTVANGGDNLGVYIPLFAREVASIPMFTMVFAMMTAIWCLVGYWLVNQPHLGVRIRQYGHIALPIVLIGLGLHILWGARELFA